MGTTAVEGRAPEAFYEPSADALCDAILVVAEAVARQVREAPSLEPRVRGESWSVADAASHLAIAQQAFTTMARGGDQPFAGYEPRAYGEANAKLLAAAGPSDAARLAEAIVRRTDAFLDVAGAAAPDGPFDTPLGPMPRLSLLSYNMAHLLQHGHSISKALGTDSPIRPGHVRLSLPFMRTAVPFAYRLSTRPPLTARVAVRVPGQVRFVLAFTGERAALEPDVGRRADCRLVIGAVPYMLVMLGQAEPLGLALRARTFAWGRRPWLALQLKDYLPGL